MASEYVRLHIMKHALEHYIKREGASDKDIMTLLKNLKILKNISSRDAEEVASAKKLDTR